MTKASLAIFLVLFLVQSFSYVDASLEETCKKLKEKSMDSVDYNFCITSLQVVPESQIADNQGLAIIATELAKANFTYNLVKTKNLLKSTGVSKGAKGALEDCSKVYKDGINQLQKAIVEFRISNVTSAYNHLTASATEVVLCIGAWEVRNENSLLLKENDNAHRIDELAIAIIIFFLQ